MRTLRKAELLGASLLAGLLFTTPSWAQEAVATTQPAPVEADEDQDRIVVTGSRIRRAPVDATVAVTTIDSIEIENRGFGNVIEAFAENPLATIAADSTGGNVQFGDNNAFIDLFNLGGNRTLSLINGRRVVSSNAGTIFVPDGNNTGAQVDLTIINPGLVERQEIVTVGSGAIYGADAVAGVTNIILKDDYEGLEFTSQFEIDEFGDGERYNVRGIWGENFLDDRANITVALEYQDQALVRTGRASDLAAVNIEGFRNPFDAGATDGVQPSFFTPGGNNPFFLPGSILAGGANFFGSGLDLIFPGPTSNQTSGGNDALLSAFIAETGLSPFEFVSQGLAAGIDPLLFVGTFNNGIFPIIPNTDPQTSAFLPFRAAPLQFAPNGDLVALDLGNLFANPNAVDQNDFPGTGFFDPTLGNIQSGQERFNANVLWRYDITDNITYNANFLFSDVESESIDGVQGNTPFGSTTGASLSIPVFYNENPFVSDQARAEISNLINLGAVLNDQPGLFGSDAQVAFISTGLQDVTGDIFTVDDSRTFRTEQAISGNFRMLDRRFDWDAAFVYGRNRTTSTDLQVLDIEFALATDVVQDSNGNIVCRQQTLDAPEDISVRNPLLAFITGPTMPTQAQVDACVPLNVIGEGNVDPAAAAFVTAPNPTENVSEQFYAAASLGGEAIQLPAGWLQFNTQFEWRDESLEFTPGPVFAEGLGRATTGQPSDGSRRFFEGGAEFLAPIFGGDFTLPGLHSLEFDGAVRVVNRAADTSFAGFAESPTVTDVTFTAGGRWSPVDWVTFRGVRARSVRSASIVELFGAQQAAFFGGTVGGGFACDDSNINSGPDPVRRQANCVQAAQILGLDPDALGLSDGTFNAGGGNIPAGTGGNPFLQNEVSDQFTAGFVLQPDFVPGRLTIAGDWFVIDIEGELGLALSVDELCFDGDNFPNVDTNGTPVCDQLIFSVEDPNNPGSFIIPDVNPLTGAPLPSQPALDIAGDVATNQEPFSIGFVQVPSINNGATEFQAFQGRITYAFGLDEAFTPLRNALSMDWIGRSWGTLELDGTLRYTHRFDVSANGTFSDVSVAAGEPGNSRFISRLDTTHTLGNFTHELQWLRTQSTLDNVQLDAEFFADQNPTFFNPTTNQFNYSAAYDVKDNLTLRFVADNFTRTESQPEFGVAAFPRGRTFLVGLTYRR